MLLIRAIIGLMGILSAKIVERLLENCGRYCGR
jgi:hypothetical protein